MDIADKLFAFYKRSKWPERVIIIIACLFLVGLALYVSKYGIASLDS